MAKDVHAPPSEDPEEEKPERRGLPLARKFALVIAITLCLLLSGASWRFHNLAVRQLEEDIDRCGAALVTTLAVLGTAFWDGKVAEKNPGEFLRAFLKENALGLDVANIYLLAENKTDCYAIAIPADELEVSGGTEGASKTDPAIEIRRGATIRDKKSGIVTPAWTFRRPVLATPGKTPPIVRFVRIDLKTVEIDRLKANLRNSILWTTGTAIAIGMMVAAWLAGIVTGPLKLLIKDIRTVSGGDLDHHTRAHSRDEIGELAETFNHMTLMMRVARESDMEKRTMEHDLSLARDIQSNLLPKRLPKIRGIDLSAFYRAAKEVGGDYYDLIPITNQHLGIAVGDVAGKGVQGSLVMAMTRAILRSVAPGQPSAAKTLIKTNHILAKDLRPGSFVTLGYYVLDVIGKTLTVGRAGHNPLLICHSTARKAEFVSPPGIALGFDPGPVFEKVIRETVVPLAKGDVAVAYTDGVVESMDADRAQYGNERFQALIVRHAASTAADIVKALVADLDRHQGEAPQHDDITVVVLKML